MANEPTKEFEIFIDKKLFKTPLEKATGLQLRDLVKPAIGEDRDLFEEIAGPDDDIKISDSEVVTLLNGMHFYTAPKSINPGGRI